jgi:pheromone shutdown protein TraB
MDSTQIWPRFMGSMTRREKLKFYMAIVSGVFVRKKRIEKEIEKFEEQEDDYIEELGKAFPSAKKAIIDDRNVYMAEAIRKINRDHENIVAVIGDGHVEGIRSLLSEQSVETIRLSQLREKEPEHVDEFTVSYDISYENQ